MSEPSKGVLLVVENDTVKRIALQMELSQAGYTVLDAADAEMAYQHLHAQPINAVILDMRISSGGGLQVLRRIKAQWPKIPVVITATAGSIESAVEAIKHGACDYLVIPFVTELLVRKLELLQLAGDWGDRSAGTLSAVRTLGPLVGRSYASGQLFDRIETAARNDNVVLLQGEAGCGMSLIARTIHELSWRKDGPLISLNCDTCPIQSLESELRAGFTRARNGTLFLDGIDALPTDSQGRLLVLLEENAPGSTTGPSGGKDTVRLICATTDDLHDAVESGRFREDLRYRLSASHIMVPPLRERREDIPILAEHFLERQTKDAGGQRSSFRISTQAMSLLVAYHWPGNARELEQVLGHAVSLADGDEIQPKDILLTANPKAGIETGPLVDLTGAEIPLVETVERIERLLIETALRRAGGNQAKASQILSIPRTTLRDKMAKYGMVNVPQRNS